jgi:cystathionine beta-lyase/cystathionine gamma-synthase
MTTRRLRPATLAIHGGERPDPATGAMEPPIVLSSAFAFPSADDAAARFTGEKPGLIYGRWENPTVRALEEKLAVLEGAEDALALASGMAAVAASIESFVRAGDHVVLPRSLYAETSRVARERWPRFGIETTFVDATDVARLEAAIGPRTKVVYVETPANPVVAVSDVAAIAALAHARGALLVVDSTFGTPYHQQPLALGADLVLHSATKAISGHGDTIGGVLAGSRSLIARARDEAVRMQGAMMSPLVAMLVARGARTLFLRQERASRSASMLAEWMASDRRVERVHYPGLPSHPGHALAARQMSRGFGSMIAVELKGGLPAGKAAYDRLEVFSRAVSLGDVRSLATHPASTTAASMGPQGRRAAGIGEGMLRLSIGIEDVEDLREDLDVALGP